MRGREREREDSLILDKLTVYSTDSTTHRHLSRDMVETFFLAVKDAN